MNKTTTLSLLRRLAILPFQAFFLSLCVTLFIDVSLFYIDTFAEFAYDVTVPCEDPEWSNPTYGLPMMGEPHCPDRPARFASFVAPLKDRSRALLCVFLWTLFLLRGCWSIARSTDSPPNKD